MTLVVEPTAVTVKHYGTSAYGTTTYGGIVQPAARRYNLELVFGELGGSWSTRPPGSSWSIDAATDGQWKIGEVRGQ